MSWFCGKKRKALSNGGTQTGTTEESPNPPRSSMATSMERRMTLYEDETARGIFDMLRMSFNYGRTRPLKFREAQLRTLIRMLTENTAFLVKTINADLGKCSYEIQKLEIEVVKREAKLMIAHLDKWSAQGNPLKHLSKPLKYANLFDRVHILKHPHGVVIVIGSYGFPLLSCLLPTVGAIAAGNCVIVKPTDLTPTFSKHLQTIFHRYMDGTCYACILASSDKMQNLLAFNYDFIYFSGNSNVASSLMKATSAGKTLLQIRSKNAAYMDNSVDYYLATKRLLWAKFANLGQNFVCPDYLVCDEQVEEEILKVAPDVLEELFGDNPMDAKELPRIINQAHFDRLVEKITSSHQGVVKIGGVYNADKLKIAPTIITNVKAEDEIMAEPINGPILCVIPAQTIDEAITTINSFPKASVLFIFSDRKELVWKIINSTRSGGVCVNDGLISFVPDLPHHGGLAQCNGKNAFEAFSNHRGLFQRKFNLWIENAISIRYPPFTEENKSKPWWSIDRLV